MSSQLDLSFIPTSAAETRRWDHEWLHYFCTEDPKQHLLTHDKLGSPAALAGKPAAEVYETKLFADLRPLSVWVPGNLLHESRNVLEIGCGCGFFGKQMGRIGKRYLGLDYSQFALSVARLTSPPECSYAHLSDAETIASMAGAMDLMVGRYFFIHQNFTTGRWVLRLASILLRTGGLVAADFWLSNPAIAHGIVHAADHGLDPLYPSCAFTFTVDEIHRLAGETGFSVEKVEDQPALQRRFVQLRRRAAA
jgi:SAM-dependent methyltransferase